MLWEGSDISHTYGKKLSQLLKHILANINVGTSSNKSFFLNGFENRGKKLNEKVGPRQASPSPPPLRNLDA